MNKGVSGQVRMKDLVPADHFLAVFLQDLQDSLIEIRLQGMVILDAFFFHKGLNLRIPVPLFALVLVPTDVHVSIRKECGHLAQKHVKEFVGRFSSRIQRWLKDSCGAFNLVWTRSATQFRMSHQPAGSVARYVK